MTQQDIQQLIDRFLDGDTTREEEQVLYALFSSGNIPDDLRPYASMFTALGDTLQPVPSPACPVPDSSANGKHPTLPFYRWAAAVAASIAIIVGLFVLLNKPQAPEEPQLAANQPQHTPTPPSRPDSTAAPSPTPPEPAALCSSAPSSRRTPRKPKPSAPPTPPEPTDNEVAEVLPQKTVSPTLPMQTANPDIDALIVECEIAILEQEFLTAEAERKAQIIRL